MGAVTLPLALLGPLLGGWLADRLYARGEVDGALRIATILVLLLTVPYILTPLLPFKMAVIAFAFAALGMGAMIGLPAVALQLITPGELRGQVAALFLFVVNVVGLGLGPPLVGLASQLLGANGLRIALSAVPAITLSLAALLLWRIRARYRAEAAAVAY
jgi:MFS family permease